MIREVVGLKGLGPALLRHGRGRKVIAFDVFNTLVCRKVEGEWLKRASAFALRRMLEPRVHRGEDNESDFNELARRWVGTWLQVDNQAVIDACIEQELALEEEALTPTPGIVQALIAARATGARLIFVSDMYLTATQIRRLLRHCGLETFFDDGYSSTDVGRRKATGRMFPWLLRTEAIEASCSSWAMTSRPTSPSLAATRSRPFTSSTAGRSSAAAGSRPWRSSPPPTTCGTSGC